MSNPLTDGLDLDEFLHIIINTYKMPNQFDAAEEQKEADSKPGPNSSSEARENINRNKKEIYSIKAATQNKSMTEVVQLIKSELQIVDNDIQIWNKMIRAISRISIADTVQSDGKIYSFHHRCRD